MKKLLSQKVSDDFTEVQRQKAIIELKKQEKTSWSLNKALQIWKWILRTIYTTVPGMTTTDQMLLMTEAIYCYWLIRQKKIQGVLLNM